MGSSARRGLIIATIVLAALALAGGSAAIHGITDAMVQDAPRFAELHGRLGDLLDGVVMIGHNIGFDAAILRAEAARAGLPWPEPPCLDTLLLAAALVTAEVWSALLPLLADAGAHSFTEARAFAATVGRVRARQQAAGW